MLKNIKYHKTAIYKTVYQSNNIKVKNYPYPANLNNRIFTTIGR